jgi:hypothetical protein
LLATRSDPHTCYGMLLMSAETNELVVLVWSMTQLEAFALYCGTCVAGIRYPMECSSGGWGYERTCADSASPRCNIDIGHARACLSQAWCAMVAHCVALVLDTFVSDHGLTYDHACSKMVH